MERTLAIIKPDAIRANNIGGVVSMIEAAGLKIVAMKLLELSKVTARRFYAVHDGKFFFEELVAFMTSGPVVVMALEGENAVARWRELMGPTDSTKAPAGTVRGEFGTTMQQNAAHGSDSSENAAIEVAFFFGE